MNQLAAARMPGPNEPCWCGSGTKYKKCHRDKDGQGGPAAKGPRVTAGKVSPRRSVPAHIPLPEWAHSGKVSDPGPRESHVRTPGELTRMRAACSAAALILQKTGALVKPGITTDELDVFAHEQHIKLGGYPSPLNYRGFPKSICTSVNEVICHGIPDDRPLAHGDIINLDITVFLNGVHGDCSATFAVGQVGDESLRLMRVAHECLMKGVEAVRPDRPVRDVGKAIEQHSRRAGMGTVRAFCGHGIGTRFHSSLQIPHFDDRDATTLMRPGMTFTVEPMITLGSWRHEDWKDGWTAVTVDGKRTAQFEHTVLVTETGVEILTHVGGIPVGLPGPRA